MLRGVLVLSEPDSVLMTVGYGPGMWLVSRIGG